MCRNNIQKREKEEKKYLTVQLSDITHTVSKITIYAWARSRYTRKTLHLYLSVYVTKGIRPNILSKDQEIDYRIKTTQKLSKDKEHDQLQKEPLRDIGNLTLAAAPGLRNWKLNTVTTPN